MIHLQNNYILSTINKVKSNYLFLPLIILILTCILFYHNIRDIKLKLAYEGYGPTDYVYQKLYPQNYAKNWPNGIMAYDNSISMQVFTYLAMFTETGPIEIIQPYMFLQILFFLFSVAFFANTLFRNSSVTIISVIIISISNLAGLNLSRFGNGFSSSLQLPLFYGYAISFSLFGIAFFLQNKYILSCVAIILSTYCHATIGILSAFFIGSYFIIAPHSLKIRKVQIGIFLFVITVTIFFLSISLSASITSGRIPVESWVKSTRIFSMHWYPVSMKLFTTNAHREFFPILITSLFFFGSLRYNSIKDEKNQKILVGIAACIVLSFIGIIFSEVYPIPFLIKLSPQRSSALLTMIAVLYLINYQIRKIQTHNYLIKYLAVTGLLMLFLSAPGISFLPLFILLYSDINEGMVGCFNISSSLKRIIKLLYGITAAMIALVSVTNIAIQYPNILNKLPFLTKIHDNLWTPLQFFNPLNTHEFLIRGGSFKFSADLISVIGVAAVLTIFFSVLYSDRKNRLISVPIIGVFLMASLLTIWYIENSQSKRWHNRYADKASSYLDVQLWAKENTSKSALFMPDPTHYYGWRDFSERSSFGNLREWGYSSIAYNPDYDNYQEGMKRMGELGIDIKRVTYNDIKENKHSISYSSLLDELARRNYYMMDDKKRTEMATRYGIDYFILKKENMHLIESSKFSAAYENKHFIVLGTKKSDSYEIPPWSTILRINFESEVHENAESISWSVQPNDQSIKWGLTNESHYGKSAIYINPSEKKDYWLYTGQGAIDKSPELFEQDNKRIRISCEPSMNYMISAYLKGVGEADIYLWYFAKKKLKRKAHLKKILLESEYREINIPFKIPHGADDLRLSVKLRGDEDQECALLMDDLIIYARDRASKLNRAVP
jgi:hypothetical protein